MDDRYIRQFSSTQQKIMLLRTRYKNTKDLWLYMTERRKLQTYCILTNFSLPMRHICSSKISNSNLYEPHFYSWLPHAVSQSYKAAAHPRHHWW